MAPTIKLIAAGLAFGLMLLNITAVNAQGYDKLGFSLQSQLKLVEDWLPGSFDNNEQIVQQSGGGISTPVYTPLIRVHMLYEKVDVPELGDVVFYVRAHRNDDPDDLLDQGLLVAGIDRDAKAVRLSMYRPRTMSKNIASAADLPIEAARWKRADKACDVLLRYEGAQMAGHTASPNCRASAMTDAESRIGQLNNKMILSDGSLWLRENVRAIKDDRTVFEYPPTGPGYVQLRRADWYNCVVHHSENGKMGETEQLTQVTLHSQGGSAQIDWPDGRKIVLNIQTREFWTPTDNRSLMLRVMEAGNPVPLVYSYSKIPTMRMGINTGWFYTLCANSTEQVF